MRLVAFLSKVALVCNLFFLLTVALHFYNFIGEDSMVSIIVIIGYALSVFIFTPLINILYLTALALRKNLFEAVPKWIVITNFIFLLLQIIYIILFLNDSFFD
jgi:hypothetical protein